MLSALEKTVRRWQLQDKPHIDVFYSRLDGLFGSSIVADCMLFGIAEIRNMNLDVSPNMLPSGTVYAMFEYDQQKLVIYWSGSEYVVTNAKVTEKFKCSNFAQVMEAILILTERAY